MIFGYLSKTGKRVIVLLMITIFLRGKWVVLFIEGAEGRSSFIRGNYVEGKYGSEKLAWIIGRLTVARKELKSIVKGWTFCTFHRRRGSFCSFAVATTLLFCPSVSKAQYSTPNLTTSVSGTYQAVSSSQFVVNGHVLSSNQARWVTYVGTQILPQLLGTLSDKVTVASRVSWWSLKEGIFSLANPNVYSNCHTGSGDVRLDPLSTCDPGQPWQVGLAAVQVPYHDDQSVIAALNALWPGRAVTDVLDEAARIAGFDSTTGTGAAIVASTGYLRRSWLLRHPVIGMYLEEPTVTAECINLADSWCYGTGWTETQLYAPTRQSAFQSISDLVAIFTTFGSTTTSISLPTSQQSFTYDPISQPVTNIDPSQAKPFGVGSVATGGDTLSLRVSLTQFAGPVDIYLAIYAPTISSDIWMIKSDLNLQPLSAGLVKWKANTTGPIDEYLYGNIPVSSLPAGTYYLYVVVTPSGSLDAYYLWETYFTITSNVISITGTWILKPNCNDNSQTFIWYIYSTGSFSDNVGTGGTWTLIGDQVTLTYNDNLHTTYNGTVNASGTYMAGTRYNDHGHDPNPYGWCATTSSGGGDTQAPTVPTGLTATAVSSSQINLSWNASTDNVGVTGYKIYRSGTYLKSVSTTSTSDTGLSPSTQYCYTVSAYDAAGKESGQSGQACATTTGGQLPGDTFDGLVVEWKQLVLRDMGGVGICSLRSQVKNTTSTDKKFGLYYNAYNSSGSIIGFTMLNGQTVLIEEPMHLYIPANSTIITENYFSPSQSPYNAVDCSQVASVALYTDYSYVMECSEYPSACY